MSYIRWKANVDSSSPYDNATLLPLVNIAKNDVAQAIAQVNPNYFGDVETYNTSAGNNSITKPDDFLLFRQLDISFSNTNPGSFSAARMMTLAEMGYPEDYWQTYGDTTRPVVREEGNTYRFYPSATASTAGTGFVKLHYTPLPADFTDLTLTTEIAVLTGIGKVFQPLIADFVINEIKGKQGILTPLEVRESNDEIRDALVPAASSSLGTFSTFTPPDTHLQY